jgi:hypothetical protein
MTQLPRDPRPARRMDLYRVLVHDFGWPHDDWIEWTAATVGDEVFGAPPSVAL